MSDTKRDGSACRSGSALEPEVGRLDPERAIAGLTALRTVLGIDSPEVRGWAPAVQQEARRAIDYALKVAAASRELEIAARYVLADFQAQHDRGVRSRAMTFATDVLGKALEQMDRRAQVAGVQACRREDRAMLATLEGAEMLAKAVAAINNEPPNAKLTG